MSTGAGSATQAEPDVKKEISNLAQPYALNVPIWEVQNSLKPSSSPMVIGDRLISPVALAAQMESVLHDEGFCTFPPVRIRLDEPPLLLVVSPRDKIEYFDRLLVSSDMSTEQMESLERREDSLNLSSLVVELGGFGAAYPAIVNPDMSIHQVINAASEEWSHQYLASRPLGFLYLLDSLGFSQKPDVIEMNETLAGIMADEIGSGIYNRYYKSEEAQEQTPAGTQAFNFAKEMRETRVQVDAMLTAGKISDAEHYMESRRIVFNDNGYKIRKLNQAYFAFHGIYGQDAGAVSKAYQEMNIIRKNYSSLSAFVKAVSAMTGYAELHKAASRQAF